MFWHKEFDVSEYLPDNWKEIIISIAKANYFEKNLVPTSVTSREGDDVGSVRVATVKGSVIRNKLKWVKDLYETKFKILGMQCINQEVFLANDERYAYNLNVQFGTEMRYECHVDSNPLEGLLYVTSHPKGHGGELVVGLNKNAKSVREVDKNCVRIYPKSGHLVFFDAREYPHYVTPLKNEEDIRIVVAMNYYTQSCMEDQRPVDLNKHLGIEN